MIRRQTYPKSAEYARKREMTETASVARPRVSRARAKGETEHDLQVRVVAFLERALAGVAWWSGIDHGAGKMSDAEAGRRKARGVKPGIPDIVVLWRGLLIGIELKAAAGVASKAGAGVQSEEQRAVEAAWLEHGAHYFVCHSALEVNAALVRVGVPLRYRVAANGLSWVFSGWDAGTGRGDANAAAVLPGDSRNQEGAAT